MSDEDLEELEAMLKRLEEFAEQRIRKLRIKGFAHCDEAALELARRGFVIVGDLYTQPRELSVDELEYIVAKGKGQIQ